MDWAIYGALIVGFAAIAGAGYALYRQIREAWRRFKRLRRRLAVGLTDLADSAERTSEIVERVSDQGELEGSLARLRVTLAKFNVLRAALDEVDDTVRRVTAVYPRK